MVRYKEKVCLLCQKVYIPKSPKQKFCNDCKDEGRKIADRKRDRIRNRKKHAYIEYTRNCKRCGIEFKTYYKKKVYCGAEKCERARVVIKNKRIHLRRPKEYMIMKGRRYYKENREKCLLKKADNYRKRNPAAKPYVGGKSNKLTFEFVKKYIESRGYKLLSTEYVNNRENLILECPKGHKWETTFHNFKDSKVKCFWCYVNGDYTSKFELSVREYINEIYSGRVIYNDRTQIISTDTGRKLELDLWFPQLGKAIECNGAYWHSSEISENRDEIKQQVCQEQGIDLLVVTDDEWLNKTGKVKVNDFIGEVQ